MINLVTFILANSGITYILTQSKIFNWLRELAKVNTWTQDFMRCSLCAGWWSSIVPYIVIYKDYTLSNIFIFCCIGSITAYLTFKIIKRL